MDFYIVGYAYSELAYRYLGYLGTFIARSLAPSCRGNKIVAFSVEVVSEDRSVPVNRLGGIEGDLERLKQVIVVCDHIERPTDRLADAVEINFERGVKYLFLVSESRAKDELNDYYPMFEALAKRQVARSHRPIQIADLVEIRKLPYNWDDFPYIFYQQVGSDGRLKTIAFVGDQVHEGIAENYSCVDPRFAHTIARTVLADAPQPIQEEIKMSLDQFTAPPTSLENYRAPDLSTRKGLTKSVRKVK